MGGCFTKHGRGANVGSRSTEIMSTDRKDLIVDRLMIDEDNNLMRGDNNPDDNFNTQRRRLSVSHSVGHDSNNETENNNDNNQSDDRGTTLLLLKESKSIEFVKDLLTPTVDHTSPRINNIPPSQHLQREEPTNPRRRLSISGCPASSTEDNFSNKRMRLKGEALAEDIKSMGIGYACKKGLKPESPNQDDFFIVRIDDWGLYGVFDGHGPFGHDVSNFVQRELPKLIYTHDKFWTNPSAALKDSFIQVHNNLVDAAKIEKFDCALSGTTASVILHKPYENKLFVAHVGDSRCVLGRIDKEGETTEVVDLTIDHKPNNESERRRILNSGGQVKRLEGDIPYRVFLKGRLYPGLAMSRAIGDLVGGQAGVIPTPEVSEVDLDPEKDEILILCSDGVWEFVTSQEAVEIAQSCGREKVQEAADVLARASWERWIEEEGNVVDDITVQVIHLHQK